jgi:cytoskeletal protein CcmA (bactofilin family)
MKPRQHICSKLLFFALLTFSLISCQGRESSEDKKIRRVFLGPGQTHEGWYFAAGDQVVIEGTVNGDAYIAGGVVEVDGTINGDLLVAGGQVTINGTVTDDIRAAGGSLRFDGKVGKNISAAGGSISIGKAAEIRGNVLSACGNLLIAGTIARELKVAAGDVSVTGSVNGNVEFGGENFSTLPGAKIGGNLRATVKEKESVEVSEGTVLGNVDIMTREMRLHRYILGFQPWFFWAKILWAVSLLFTGLVLMLIFPKQLVGIGSTISQLPGKSFLWGIVALFLTPIAVGLLLITIVGLPLGLFLLVMFLWIVYLSQLSLGVFVGDRLFGMEGKSKWNLFWAYAVGLLMIQALTFIPYVRFLVVLVGLIFGTGAILLQLKSAVYEMRVQLYKKI